MTATAPRFAAVLFDLDAHPVGHSPRSGRRRQSCAHQLLDAPPAGLHSAPHRLRRRVLGLLKAGFWRGRELSHRDTPALRQALLDYYAAHLYEVPAPTRAWSSLSHGSTPMWDPLGHSDQQVSLSHRTPDGSGA